MTYELIIQHNGTVMFPAVVEDVTIEWERQGQPGKLSFEVVKTDGLSFQEGDPCRFSVDGSPFFMALFLRKPARAATPRSSRSRPMTRSITSRIRTHTSTQTKPPRKSSRW